MSTITDLEAATAARLVEDAGGVLRMAPAWVARDWLPPGGRLGVPDAALDVGERGAICERWLASTTRADNRVGPDDEGLSHVRGDRGEDVLLTDLVAAVPEAVMGPQYAAAHEGLGRLAKIYDFAARIPFHIHPRTRHADLVGRTSKDEAYYFPPDVPLGPHPESYFGVHPSVVEQGGAEVLLPHLERWDSDAILQHSKAYLNVQGEGFSLPSGVLHGPGTALTIELQEDSDCLAMFQALNAGAIISKELLYKDVPADLRAALGERAPLDWVDWAANADPRFYENHRLTPRVLPGTPDGVEEAWVFYGSPKFSGKRLTLRPGARHTTVEPGVHTVLAWQGQGTVAGAPVRGRTPGEDELLLVDAAARSAHEIVNTGAEHLVLLTFFGPDLHPDAPMLPAHPTDGA